MINPTSPQLKGPYQNFAGKGALGAMWPEVSVPPQAAETAVAQAFRSPAGLRRVSETSWGNCQLFLLKCYLYWAVVFRSGLPCLYLCSPVFEREGKAREVVILAKVSDSKRELSQLPTHIAVGFSGHTPNCRMDAHLASPKHPPTHPPGVCGTCVVPSPGDPEMRETPPLARGSSDTSGEMGMERQ